MKFPFFLIVLTLVAFGCAETKEEQQSNTEIPQKKNILLLVGDDIGYSDLGLFGSEIPTPNLDALASEGVTFTNFHSTPSCSVTRSSLLTGCDPHQVGLGAFDYMIYPGQEDNPDYCGYLNDAALTIPTLLRDNGYHTYMAGKWHLGDKEGYRPPSRGFEESYGILEGGASHFSSYGFLPTRPVIETYENGVEVERPEGVYSDDLYLQKLQAMIDKNKDDDKPFFAYFAFQTAHLPIMAPDEFIAKFDGRYAEGWEVLRAQRREALIAKGLLSEDADMFMTNIQQPQWDSLSPEMQRRMAKKMAVYAAMINHQDYTIGRMLDYLKSIGEYDNTLIIYMPDNGPESGSEIGPRAVEQPIIDWWNNEFDNSIENIGRLGSNAVVGSGWAFASASPGNFFKFYVSEGGTRVPMIIKYPESTVEGGSWISHFTGVKDIGATMLEYAGIEHPGSEYKGKTYAVPSGKSILPFLEGRSDKIHADDEYIGTELFGNISIFMGDYNLKRIRRGMKGSNEWELYHSVNDPGETRDLKDELPEIFAKLMAAKDDYVKTFGVMPVDDDWDPYSALK